MTKEIAKQIELFDFVTARKDPWGYLGIGVVLEQRDVKTWLVQFDPDIEVRSFDRPHGRPEGQVYFFHEYITPVDMI